MKNETVQESEQQVLQPCSHAAHRQITTDRSRNGSPCQVQSETSHRNRPRTTGPARTAVRDPRSQIDPTGEDYDEDADAPSKLSKCVEVFLCEPYHLAVLICLVSRPKLNRSTDRYPQVFAQAVVGRDEEHILQ